MFPYYQVQGWGRRDPLACFQLQKQAKKHKANETSNNCQFCLDTLQRLDNSIGQEAKTTRNQSKSEGELSVHVIVDTASEKEEISTHSSKSNCCPTRYNIKMELQNKLRCSNIPRGNEEPVNKKNTVCRTWKM